MEYTHYLNPFQRIFEKKKINVIYQEKIRRYCVSTIYE